MTSTDLQHDDTWDACPAGEIDGLVTDLRQRKQQQNLQKLSAVGGVLVVLLVFGFWMAGTLPHESKYGGIACSEVKEQAKQYISETLSEDLMGKIAVHLTACPRCEEAIAKMRASAKTNSPDSGSFEISTAHPDANFSRRLMAATW